MNKIDEKIKRLEKELAKAKKEKQEAAKAARQEKLIKAGLVVEAAGKLDLSAEELGQIFRQWG